MNFLKRLFAVPTFEDEVKTQQAYLLNVILWTLICVPISFVIYSLFRTPENITRTFAQAGFGETVNIILLVMLRRVYVRAASIIQVSAFWLFFTATILTGSGIRGEAYLLGYRLISKVGTKMDEQNSTIFFVRDNGIGISPKYHENIFGLFNKLNATSEGTGIGLALVKRIIEVHGGRIWVESEAGKGATFYFILPTR